MDPEVVIAEASAPPPPEPVEVPEPKPVELEEFVHKQYEEQATLAAAESKPGEPKEPEAKAADTEVKPAEPKTEPAATTAPPFTEEELGDGAFLGRLDADGWAKLEAYNPSLYKAAKAVARAQGTVYELKRRLETQAQSTPEPEKKEDPTVTLRAEAIAKTDSLDPEERAEGFATLARLEAEKIIKERDEATGYDPAEAQAQAAERSAYRAAVKDMPELADLPSTELDAAVEADPELMDDVKFAVSLEPEARTVLLAKVMRRAGRIVLANRAAAKAAADADAAKKAKDAKDAEAQKRLRSNENNPSKVVAETPGGKTPKGERTIEETIHEKVAALKTA